MLQILITYIITIKIKLILTHILWIRIILNKTDPAAPARNNQFFVVVVVYVVIVVAAAAIRSYLKTSVVGGAGNRDTEAGFGSTRRRESDAGMRRNAARRLKTKKVN